MENTLKDILDYIVAHIDLTQVRLIAGFIGVNFVTAVAAGIKTGEFQLSKVGEFLYKKLLPYVLIYAAGSLFGDVIGFPSLQGVSFVAITSILTGDFLDSLYKLGLRLPEFLVKKETLFKNNFTLLTLEPTTENTKE